MNFKIEDFFDRSYELQINENMFYYSYKFPHNEVCEYLESIINTPYSEFVTYIQNHIQCDYITSKDIPQFSSFKNCTKNICKKLLEVNDPGLQFIEIGKLLLDDGNSRNDVAYRKYGENHSKTAFELGLTQFKDSTWYLSCIGYKFLSFDEKSQIAIISRCLLRNKFISRIIGDSLISEVNIVKYMHCLSKSTMTRRKPNIMFLINMCQAQFDNVDSNLSKKIYCEF